jgi:winged helix DNA-binding protein
MTSRKIARRRMHNQHIWGAPLKTLFTHAVLLDGRLIGHWKPMRTKDSVTDVTAHYRRLSREESRALDAAVDRYGRFVGVPARVA